MNYLKKRFHDFISDKAEYGTCILNAIMCSCMAYFYYDSRLYVPLIYSAFFLLYIIVVFLVGKKIIPLMYVLFIVGATQNITFINCTGFLLLLFLIWQFPKQKIFLLSIYILDIFFVCYRHGRTEWHLVCHFALCIVLWFFGEMTKSYIELKAIEKAKLELRNEIELEIRESIEKEVRERIEQERIEYERTRLDLTDSEFYILSEITSGKAQKEIEGFSENTITTKIKNAMLRNNCSKDELKMRFLQQNEKK